VWTIRTNSPQYSTRSGYHVGTPVGDLLARKEPLTAETVEGQLAFTMTREGIGFAIDGPSADAFLKQYRPNADPTSMLDPRATIATMAAGADCRTPSPPDSTRGSNVVIHVITPPPPPAETLLTRPMAPGSPLLIDLTRKARRVAVDSLYVHSSFNPDSGPYVGVALADTLQALFEPFYAEIAFPHSEPMVFVTVRLVLDPRHVGYILRVPGMYEPSRLDLLVYDAGTMRFQAPIELAELYGDEGCVYSLSSRFSAPPAVHGWTLSTRQTTAGCRDDGNDSVWVRSWTSAGFGPSTPAPDSLAVKIWGRAATSPRSTGLSIHPIQARLIYDDSTLSDNIVGPNVWTLWNTIIGEGDAKKPSHSTLIEVPVTAPPGYNPGSAVVELSVAGGHYDTRLMRLVPFDSSGLQLVRFRLDRTGCERLAMKAELRGSGVRDSVFEDIEFECGE